MIKDRDSPSTYYSDFFQRTSAEYGSSLVFCRTVNHLYWRGCRLEILKIHQGWPLWLVPWCVIPLSLSHDSLIFFTMETPSFSSSSFSFFFGDKWSRVSKTWKWFRVTDITRGSPSLFSTRVILRNSSWSMGKFGNSGKTIRVYIGLKGSVLHKVLADYLFTHIVYRVCVVPKVGSSRIWWLIIMFN